MDPVRILASQAPRSVMLIRLAVGAVFLSEGIQKFLFPAELGAGRFTRIGLPSPEILGPLVGGFEIACGAAVLAEVRTDWTMLLGSAFLLAAGAGPWSVDARLHRRLRRSGQKNAYRSDRSATRAQSSTGPG